MASAPQPLAIITHNDADKSDVIIPTHHQIWKPTESSVSKYEATTIIIDDDEKYYGYLQPGGLPLSPVNIELSIIPDLRESIIVNGKEERKLSPLQIISPLLMDENSLFKQEKEQDNSITNKQTQNSENDTEMKEEPKSDCKYTADVKIIKTIQLPKIKALTRFSKLMNSICGCLILTACCCSCSIGLIATAFTLNYNKTIGDNLTTYIGSFGIVCLFFIILFCAWSVCDKYSVIHGSYDRPYDISGIMIMLYRMDKDGVQQISYKHYLSLKQIPHDLLNLAKYKEPALRTFISNSDYYRSWNIDIVSQSIIGRTFKYPIHYIVDG